MIRYLLLACMLLVGLSGYGQSGDSLAVHSGLPVVFKGDTLFYIHSKIGPYKAADRVNTITRRINSLITESEFDPDSLYIMDSELSTDIWWRDRVVFSISDMDGKAENVTRKQLAKNNLVILAGGTK